MTNVIKFIPILAVLFTPLFALASPKVETQVRMLSAYETFKELQKFMVTEDDFSAEATEIKVSKLLHRLKDSFHNLENINSKYKSEPGFVATLLTLKSLLSDVVDSYDEDRKSWAYWRIKATSNYCQACHMSHGIGIEYDDSKASLDSVPKSQRAEFFLATRQFDKARDLFFRNAVNASKSSDAMNALRKWLMINIKIESNPHITLRELQKASRKIKLVSHDREELSEWLESIKRWINEGPTSATPIRKAENLLRQSMNLKEPFYAKVATVEVLRATSLLEDSLNNKSLSKKDKQAALYLLGFAYSKLPAFMINELPEFFLEQCIREFPGTKWAKSSFKLYKELLEYSYTGSSGLHLPGDVQLKLDELYKISQGIVSFTPSV